MSKSNNSDRRTCVSSWRENYSIKTNWSDTFTFHTFPVNMCILCAYCTVVCMCGSQQASIQKLSAKLSGLFFCNTCRTKSKRKIDPALNFIRDPKQTTTWLLSSIYSAYDNMPDHFHDFYLSAHFPFYLLGCWALFFRCCCCCFFSVSSFFSCFHVHVHYCVFDTFLIVIIVTVLLIPILRLRVAAATAAAGCGCA